MTLRSLLAGATLLVAAGCASPYQQDRLAGAGGLLGAGAGALIGSQSGNPAAGAIIGAGVGALTGSVVGGSIDEAAARNRAQIEAAYGRQVPAGTATPDQVVALSRAGVSPALIVDYVRTSGVDHPATVQEVIALHQQGVPSEVIQAMQSPPPAPSAPPIVIEEQPLGYGPPVFYPPGPPCGFYGPRCGPRVGWGISISN
ncbi:hypothetical protein Pla175_40570 [Pirellulimonas nuda]|uniref:Glycine zipper domain-containing protein n=1 Tax=Pirellulimonas nuda TaxID=2528009 RepID=A0A518DGP9_9BACT|nr:glycine zipper domain-containing protein [Pirellulimonas nuda]QDU90648.1 hypothetical protein Pla175_40570 [Pirellulimonas nuda]